MWGGGGVRKMYMYFVLIGAIQLWYLIFLINNYNFYECYDFM